MHKAYPLHLSLLVVATLFVGCGSPPPPPKPIVYPDISEIAPPHKEYLQTDRTWNTDAVCWVGVPENAAWNNFTGSRDRFADELVPLIRQVLSQSGYTVKSFENQYLTRRMRLSIDRIILCKQFEIDKTMVKQGACYDMRLALTIINPSHTDQPASCEVFGRSLVPTGQTIAWPDIYTECINNLARDPVFREILELPSAK